MMFGIQITNHSLATRV